MNKRYTWRTFGHELVMLVLAAGFCLPLYILISVALKPNDQLFTKPWEFPAQPDWGNFSEAWGERTDPTLTQSLLSSAIITISAVVILIVTGSLCSYVLARRPGRLSNLLYVLFLLGIIVPFQLCIVPLYVGFRTAGITGTYLSMIILWVGVFMPLTVFLYTGFVRQLPRDYEESARVDGAGIFRIFFRVVFPLLRPVTGTVAIMTGLFIWNDFFASLVFLGGTQNATIPVAIYSFVGEYLTKWNLVFAVVIIALAPLVIFFVLAQKQMIRGFAGGIRG
ncbi:MAG: carbohydrate ABC transporter permease [Bifidobacteriaceae bacterium]|nr:carbohydrate ABC transporter permease [Bifidobacteriaceae bacterium]